MESAGPFKQKGECVQRPWKASTRGRGDQVAAEVVGEEGGRARSPGCKHASQLPARSGIDLESSQR